MYLAEDPLWMICQGPLLDSETFAELRHVGADEGGVRVPTKTDLRAVALVLAQHGRPAMHAEVEAFLAEQRIGATR